MPEGKFLKGPQLKNVPNGTLGQFFFDSATKFADRVCQIDAFTDHHETYATVKEKSTRVALKMQDMGITSEDIAVLCSSVTLDAVVPLLSSFYLGAKVISLDPSLLVKQSTYLLSLVPPKIIFIEESSLKALEDILKNFDVKPKIVIFGKSDEYIQYSDLLKPHPKEQDFQPVWTNPEDTGIMFFSSGSSGLPKVICHSHRSFLNVIFSIYQSSAKLDTMLYFTSFYWVSASFFLGCSFAHGGRRIVCGSTVEAEKTYQVIEKYKVTYMYLASILTYKLTNFVDYDKYDTSSLCTFLSGGTPLSSAQFFKIAKIFKHARFTFAYGLTECGLVASFYPTDDQEMILDKVGSCGRVLPGITLKVVDIETEEVLGPNQKGEIRIKSPSVMQGYYHKDCSEVFDETNFFKTGDIGYYDEDNCLYIVERIKEMFKYMSWHVVPSTIETVLFEHPAVADVVVFGLPLNEEEGEVPTACVVLKKDCQVKREELEDFVAKRVSDKERLRGGVYFREKLLRTPTGKLMRKEIRESMMRMLKAVPSN